MKLKISPRSALALAVFAIIQLANCGGGSPSGFVGNPAGGVGTGTLPGTTTGQYAGSCIVNGLCENYTFNLSQTTSAYTVTGTINAWSSEPVLNWCMGTQVSNYKNTGTSLSYTSPATQCAALNGVVSPNFCSGAYYCSFAYAGSGSTAQGAINTSTMVLTSH